MKYIIFVILIFFPVLLLNFALDFHLVSLVDDISNHAELNSDYYRYLKDNMHYANYLYCLILIHFIIVIIYIIKQYKKRS